MKIGYGIEQNHGNNHTRNKKHKNSKQSHYRPRQALRIPGGWGSQILRQSAHQDGKFVSPKHRPPLPPGNISGTDFCYRMSQPQAVVRPEGLCQLKNPVTPSGIEPATFRFVAQCLIQCATARPRRIMWIKNSNYTIGNQTRDLPAFITASQPTEPPWAP
jgi:hypothetical protein